MHGLKESEFKAHIERFWLTINRNLLHSLPGATFADKHPKINELLKIGYDPIKDAVMTYSVFIKAFFIWLIDIYHQSKHRGLKGRTPQSAWLESYQKYPIQPLDNKIDLTASRNSY